MHYFAEVIIINNEKYKAGMQNKEIPLLNAGKDDLLTKEKVKSKQKKSSE